MHVDDEQRAIAAGMSIGLLISIGVVTFGSSLLTHLEAHGRFGVGLLLPAAILFVAIARLAKHRFFTSADIGGSGLGAGTERARILQSMLQNTLEQVVLAIPVYLVALFGPHDRLQATVPACACLFVLGRLLFFAGYEHGARARALGFALTFYPTALLLAWQLLWLLFDFFG